MWICKYCGEEVVKASYYKGGKARIVRDSEGRIIEAYINSEYFQSDFYECLGCGMQSRDLYCVVNRPKKKIIKEWSEE